MDFSGAAFEEAISDDVLGVAFPGDAFGVAFPDDAFEVAFTDDAFELAFPDDAFELAFTDDAFELAFTDDAFEMDLSDDSGEVTFSDEGGEVVSTELELSSSIVADAVFTVSVQLLSDILSSTCSKGSSCSSPDVDVDTFFSSSFFFLSLLSFTICLIFVSKKYPMHFITPAMKRLGISFSRFIGTFALRRLRSSLRLLRLFVCLLFSAFLT